jgi:hypothetical protein
MYSFCIEHVGGKFTVPFITDIVTEQNIEYGSAVRCATGENE